MTKFEIIIWSILPAATLIAIVAALAIIGSAGRCPYG